MSKKKALPSNPRRAPKPVRKRKHTEEQPKPKKTAKSQPVFPAVIADLQERERMGIKKYGQALHSHNGRDALADAYQESLDQTLYLKQKLMEQDGIIVSATETLKEDLFDLIPRKISPFPTPELRPLEHFPAPIMPPNTTVEFFAEPVVLEKRATVRRPWYEFSFVPQIIHNWFKTETVLEEAQRIVNGPRGENYGHPFDDFSRTAGMLSALLTAKLREPLTPEDVAKAMVCVKLSRETNKPSRDNRVDAAGYIECLDKVIAERARREVR